MRIKDALVGEEATFVTVDYYLPFSVEIGDSAFSDLYVRYGDQTSLLEFGVSLVDGSIKVVNLVQVRGLTEIKLPELRQEMETGLPQFDLPSLVERNCYDTNTSVKLALDKGNAFVILDEFLVVDRVVRNGDLIFAFSNGCLCWVILKNLKSEQIEVIADAVDYESRDKYFQL